jgi:hypothetical protein
MHTQGNKVFVHWQQPVRERAATTAALSQDGGGDAVDGILVLVFDERGKVAQVVDFHAPSAWERCAPVPVSVPVCLSEGGCWGCEVRGPPSACSSCLHAAL